MSISQSLVPGTKLSPWKVSVLEGHALWAESYDRMENPLLALEERVIDAVLPASIDGYVLDVACGTGRWLRKLLGLGARGGIGVDFSPEMLAKASIQRNLRGKLVRADCRAIPLPKRAVDFIVCAFALGHVRDVEAFGSELVRVSKFGASIWVTDFHPEGQSRGWKRSFRHGDRSIEICSEVRTCEEIRKAFHCAGMQLIQSVDAYLGNPERTYFERAGKLSQFESACKTPAVLIMEFQSDSGSVVPIR